MKIMIVDDHADMRRVLCDVAKNSFAEAIEIMECETGEAAIAQYPLQKPDWVLMDVELKSMSGFKVTEEIYSYDKKAKVIIVTSFDTPTFRRKAKKLKVQGFVSKDDLSDMNNILSNFSNK